MSRKDLQTELCIVKKRFEDKVQYLKTEEGKSYCKSWMDRAKLHIENFRSNEPIYLEVSIVAWFTWCQVLN